MTKSSGRFNVSLCHTQMSPFAVVQCHYPPSLVASTVITASLRTLADFASLFNVLPITSYQETMPKFSQLLLSANLEEFLRRFARFNFTRLLRR